MSHENRDNYSLCGYYGTAVLAWLAWALLEVFTKDKEDMEKKTSVREFIENRVRELGSCNDLDSVITMAKAGLDSLDYVCLIIDIEEEFNINIKDKDLNDSVGYGVENVRIETFIQYIQDLVK